MTAKERYERIMEAFAPLQKLAYDLYKENEQEEQADKQKADAVIEAVEQVNNNVFEFSKFYEILKGKKPEVEVAK